MKKEIYLKLKIIQKNGSYYLAPDKIVRKIIGKRKK